MRRAAKVDANQPAIVQRFRQWGASVTPTHAVGGGFPDLVVGLCGVTIAVEVKDGAKSQSRQALTDEQKGWFRDWDGWAEIVATVDDVDRLCEHIRQRHARRYQDAIAPREIST